jgi:endonuclease G, mitochondrial
VGRSLAATAYVLYQTTQLDDIDSPAHHELQDGDTPLLGPYRTYQVPIADIVALTG